METSPTRIALLATLHCLSGCAVGEITGTVIGSGLGWSNWGTETLAILLAFVSGYGLTVWGLRHANLNLGGRAKLALASDTLSIGTMEIIDTLIMLLVPGALSAGPTTGLFWLSLAIALIVAGAAAWPVNRWLIQRGRGHSLMHHAHH
jgi:hypothetical protein